MDKVLKQRLIGASILIALAVIFVPMLFDGPAPDSVSREMNIDLPSAPGDRATVRRMPLNPEQTRTSADAERANLEPSSTERIAPPRMTPEIASRPDEDRPSRDDLTAEIESQTEQARAEPPATSSADPLEESATTTASTEPDVEPEPAVADSETTQTVATIPAPAAPQPEPDDAASAIGFEVQVASFGSRQNADGMVERLARLGHVASIDLLVRGSSELHRVRTGPYFQRNDAERALEQIKQTIGGVDPVIVGASVSDLSEQPDGTGFAVQVGSFASRNNAVRLLGQLGGQGYEAFVHEDMAGSRTIWRVRVGPLVTRDEAVQRLARMTEDDGIDGLVVSHP